MNTLRVFKPPPLPSIYLVSSFKKAPQPVKMIHTPVHNELLENNAIRATELLTSLLKHLESREAIISIPSSRIEKGL